MIAAASFSNLSASSGWPIWWSMAAWSLSTSFNFLAYWFFRKADSIWLAASL